MRGRIENDRWYDIKIALNGDRIRCYLDGDLIHDTTAPSVQKFFAVAGRDNDTGDIIFKAINVSDDPVSATFKLLGLEAAPRTAALTILESANLSDNNSLEQPSKVTPKESPLANPGPEFSHQFPPRSLSILRLKTR